MSKMYTLDIVNSTDRRKMQRSAVEQFIIVTVQMSKMYTLFQVDPQGHVAADREPLLVRRRPRPADAARLPRPPRHPRLRRVRSQVTAGEGLSC